MASDRCARVVQVWPDKHHDQHTARSFVVLLLFTTITITTATTTTTITPPWTIDRSCHLPSDVHSHPASVHRPTLLNLGRVHDYIQPTFHLVFYGQSHLDEVCGLRGGILYHVRRTNSTAFTFFYNHKDYHSPHGSPSNAASCPSTTADCQVCPGTQMELGPGSHGFLACSNAHDAREAAWAWWRGLPNSYIVPVMISVAVGVAAVFSVSAAVLVMRIRRRRRAASLEVDC